MRTYLINNVVERSLHVVEHCVCKLVTVLIRNLLVKDRNIACFLYVSRNCENHPQRVIVEVGAKLMVTHLCKGLILVICTAVLKHCSGKVDKSFSCSCGNLVYEAE